jgi:hypothetical protein
MNHYDIHEAGWMYRFCEEAVQWLGPIVYVIGLGIAVWAFRRCRKRGYLVVALYFALALFVPLAMPSINRVIRAHSAPDISEQTQQKIDAAVKQAIDQVTTQEGLPLVAHRKSVFLPIAPLVLVIGLWLIAKREPRENRANKSLQATAAAPSCCD